MSFQTARASEKFSSIVHFYWSSTNTHTSECLENLLPTGMFEMTFYQEGLPEVSTFDGVFQGSSFLSGQKMHSHSLKIGGKFKLFSVVFKPSGLAQICKLPLAELKNTSISPNDLFGRETTFLEEKLFDCKSFTQQIEVFENFLDTILSQNYFFNDHIRIQKSILHIEEVNTNLTVHDLAKVSCLSLRQFERLFSARIGCSPSEFLQIRRFQYSIYLKNLNPNLSLTQLAYLSGFADQSHFVRSYQKFTGYTPKKLFQEGVFSDYFLLH